MIPTPMSTGQLGWTAVFASFFVLLGVIVRQMVPWRRIGVEASVKLRDDMVGRIQELERRLDRQQIRHNAERSLDNHQLRNITACFDAFLLLIEMSPDRSSEIVVKIKEMRASQIVAEAEEKAIIRAAEIHADEREQDHDGN